MTTPLEKALVVDMLNQMTKGTHSPEMDDAKVVFMNYLQDQVTKMGLPNEQIRKKRSFALTLELAKLGSPAGAMAVAEIEGFPMEELRAVYAILFK